MHSGRDTLVATGAGELGGRAAETTFPGCGCFPFGKLRRWDGNLSWVVGRRDFLGVSGWCLPRKYIIWKRHRVLRLARSVVTDLVLCPPSARLASSQAHEDISVPPRCGNHSHGPPRTALGSETGIRHQLLIRSRQCTPRDPILAPCTRVSRQRPKYFAGEIHMKRPLRWHTIRPLVRLPHQAATWASPVPLGAPQP